MHGNPILYLGLAIAAGVGFLAQQQGFASVPGFIPVLSILFIAWPSFRSVIRIFGVSRGAGILVLLGAFALFIEVIGVMTGYPYGTFRYIGDLGWRIFGLVPWTVPFAWVPLLLGAVSLYPIEPRALIRGSLRAAGLLTLIDFVLDPGAVSVGLWRYANPGPYYEVPWTNFAGWLLVGTLASILLARFMQGREAPPEMGMSSAWMMAFWSAVALGRGLWIPSMIGLGRILFISYRHVRRS